MKIKTIDASTKRPTKNQRIQLQVKGKDSGYLTLTSDMEGYITLEDKYKGQQIAVTTTGGQPSFTTATDGATLTVTTGGPQGGQGGKEKKKETWK